MSTDEPTLTAEQAAHSAAVRAALAPTEDGHGTWTILVYCDDESHEKRYNIGEFRITTQLYDEWLSFWAYFRRGRDHKRRLTRRIRRGMDTTGNTNHQNLAGDRYMRKPSEFGTSMGSADVRYPLRCPKCGLSLPWRRRHVRREDALNLALDKLVIAGETKIALSALRRIVNS